MKKLVLFFCLLISLSAYSQRTGISYQALIINPDGEQLPGFNNQNAPLVNTAICLEFIIIDHNNSIEYSEYQSVTTDKYGMVNLTIGTGNFAGGSSGGWDNIIWSENSKKLRVRLDTSGNCSGFVEISNQDLTSVPFALFAPGQEGRDGESAYEIWISEGNRGTVQQFLESLKGDKGDDGLSAYQVWKELGNSETEQDFIDSLKGEKGDEGKSAYQIWLNAGNTGTEEEFLASLKGSDGGDGASAQQSLIKTTIEAAGDNCTNGGIKIETGIDSNADGVLDDNEVNTSQTKYLCNGSDGADGEDGVNGSGSGVSSLDGTIPSNVVNVNINTSDYTIPSGYVGEISHGFRRLNFSSSDFESGSYGNQISINGTVYNTGMGLSYGNNDRAFSHNSINGSIWVNEGAVIGAPNESEIEQYVVKLHSKSLFSPKLITSESTVPSGKIWKLSSILIKGWQSIENSAGTVRIRGNIDDKPYLFAQFNSAYSGGTPGSNYEQFLDGDIWFPAGTKISPFENVLAFSILEYDQGVNNAGTGSTATPSSDNSASSNSLIYTVNGF
tara:strand:- start:517 stop:2184 length:1668 start_codon:yes stop_codon:yes gene_type:complete